MDKRNINKEIHKNNHKRRIKALLARVSLLAILLIVSTYAWFTSQKDITLSNIRGTVEVVENMEISLDAKTWYQKIDLANAETVFATAQQSRDAALNETAAGVAKTTALAVLPEQLFPVSGVGKTGVAKLPLYAGEATSTSLSGIAECTEIPEDGYIAFDMYIKNTSRDNAVDVLQLNINSSAQVLTETINKTITDVTGNRVNREYNGNEASGLQNTIRVALAKYAGEVSSTATQIEILNSTKGTNIADIAIWEPNAYDHVESIVSNNNKLINGTNTEKIEFVAYHPNNPLETYALNENAVGQTIENVYNIASTGLGTQNTFKTDNIKEGNEIQSYRIKAENDKPIDIKNISNNNFEISSNSVTRYRVYIWLEGQDVDCINVASLGGGIELDLGLTKDDEIGDVIQEIDSRVSYTLDDATNKVTATITMDKVITSEPTSWTYVDETTKLAIEKEYVENTIEQVEVKTEDGKITKVEILIDEFELPTGSVTVPDGILVDLIKDAKADNYGLHTNYPIDIDGDTTDNDWRIFYSDDTNVFLIADDYVLNSKLSADTLAATGLTTSGTYTVYWEETFDFPMFDSKYMFSKAEEFTDESIQYEAIGSLLATSNWTDFVNSTYAVDAIGSPTLEMLCASWNTVYDAINYPNEQLYCNNNNDRGYYIGTTSEPTTMSLNVMTDFAGYTDTDYRSKLYFPHKESYNEVDAYWIASPSAGDPASENTGTVHKEIFSVDCVVGDIINAYGGIGADYLRTSSSSCVKTRNPSS